MPVPHPRAAAVRDPVVALDSLDLDTDEFHRSTGWDIKPEGACKGEMCVPLPGGFELASTAERLGMALVRDDEHDCWALGPESVGGRALVTAVAPAGTA